MNCLICKNKEIKKLSVKFNYILPFLKKSNLYHCNKCGLLFLFPLKKDEIDSFYSKEYRIKHDNLETPSEEYVKGRQYIAKLRANYTLKILKKMGLEKKRLLDIGCSEGSFLQIMAKKGFKCYGSEINKEFSNFAKKKGLNVEIGSIEDYKEDKKFDVITLWHVFEHFYDPIEKIKKIKRLLKKEGILIINVPNTKLKRLINKKVEIEHYFHYNIKNFKMLFENNGFKTIKIETNNLGSHVINQNLAERISKNKKILNLLRPIYHICLPLLKKIRFSNKTEGKNLSVILKKK